jgi:tRNA threonylcarbamoyladenosine biosynthesis protein TsaB
MWLLAADTSGKNGSIALARGHHDGTCDLLQVVPLQGGTFSAQLIPQIMALLEKYQLKKEDIGAFAVTSGPGSFTGLRVGLAAFKALAEILNKPIAAVSLLEVVAVSAGSGARVTAALNAGRNELYIGCYEHSDSGAKLIAEKLVKESDLDSSAQGTLITPDEKLAVAAKGRGLLVELVAEPRADAVARLGWKKILAGETVEIDALDANYIRRSDAEIFSKP